jgi:uncharacterized membrane protein
MCTLVAGALCAGLALAVLTPPLDAPDEVHHMMRAYLLSEGRLQVMGRAAGAAATVPEQLLALHHFHAPERSRAAPRHPPRTLLETYREPFDPSRRLAVGRRTIVYSPLTYLPQALGMALVRHAGGSAAAIVLGGRLANLLAWLALSALAVRICGARAWSFTVASLVPMVVFLAATLSADAMTTAVALLFAALVWRAIVQVRTSGQARLALVGASAALGLVKPGCQVLLGMLFAIPGRAFESRGARVTTLASCLAAGLASAWIWRLYVSSADPVVTATWADPAAQLRGIVASPFDFVGVLASTLRDLWWSYARGYVGVLGYLNVYLPAWLYPSLLLLIVAVAALDGPDPPAFGAARRLYFVSLAAAGVVFVLVANYLVWTKPFGERIEGAQGRHFAPFAPLVLLAIPALGRIPRGAGWGIAAGVWVGLGFTVYRTISFYYR